jgi:hypothetical protein
MILCIEGGVPKPWTSNKEIIFREKLSDFDCVRIITPKILPYHLQKTWLCMLAKGITNILFAMAIFSDSGDLVFTGEKFILPFIGLN